MALIADLADLEEVVDIELVNRIKGHARLHVKRPSRQENSALANARSWKQSSRLTEKA